MKTRKVAVLGATGVVGQRFISLLDSHPWFRVAELVASDGNRGLRYADCTQWREAGDFPTSIGDLEVKSLEDNLDADLVFSALPSGMAGPAERKLAALGRPVFTNAADLRMEEDVPILVPEVNPDHLALVERRSGDGYVVANGNCTSVILSLALKPLMDHFGLDACHVVSFQALSGAGYPGVPSLDVTANVIPYVPNEEEKVETEPRKILGTVEDGRISPASIRLSATCTRVPVLEGHTEVVTVRLLAPAGHEDIVEALRSFRGRPQELRLPSAPSAPIRFREEVDRPQPQRDAMTGNGMAVTVGRLRPDPLLGWRFVVTGSNTVRGAAGGAILSAELAVADGLA